MLTIEAKKKNPETWGLGDEEAFPATKTQDVIALAADGAELALILAEYAGIPHTNEDSQVWVGDFARQIFANLPSVIVSQQQKGKKKKPKPAVGPMD